jgi:hypothetical protein
VYYHPTSQLSIGTMTCYGICILAARISDTLYHGCCVKHFVLGATWKKSATMSQSAESGAALVPECWTTDPWYASLQKHDSVWIVTERRRFHLWLETQWSRGTSWIFLCQNTIHGRYVTCKFYWLIFTNYNLKDAQISSPGPRRQDCQRVRG